MSKYRRVFVSPNFAEMLKVEAAKCGKSIIRYTDDITKEIREDFDPNEKIRPKKQLKGFFHEFQF